MRMEISLLLFRAALIKRALHWKLHCMEISLLLFRAALIKRALGLSP